MRPAILVVGWECFLVLPMTRFFRIFLDQARLVPYHAADRQPQIVGGVGVCVLRRLRQGDTVALSDGHGLYHIREEFFEGCMDVEHHTIVAARRLEPG